MKTRRSKTIWVLVLALAVLLLGAGLLLHRLGARPSSLYESVVDTFFTENTDAAGILSR